jgi:predicted unusual protein kinase regulating ubiquinone biosynthesis (AarF/ABC1/UbiB family)
MLDLRRCSAAPVAGGGFGDVYQGYLKNGVEVAIKCARVFLNTADLNRIEFKVRGMVNWSELH